MAINVLLFGLLPSLFVYLGRVELGSGLGLTMPRATGLAAYTAEEFAHVRVEACDSCRHYIKTVDLTKDGRAVPVYNDKHLSYSFEKARWMVETARRLRFPLLAGSSLPVTWRLRELELPLNCRIESAYREKLY